VFYVLGGNGFVGSAFLRYFKNNDQASINITRNNYDDYKGTKCDVFINADGNSKKYIAEKYPLKDFEMNVRTSLQTVLDFNFEKYILISSIDVYNDLSNPENNTEDASIVPENLSNYGFDKYLSEQIIKKYCNNWLIFRLGGMVGKNLKKGPVYDIIHTKNLFVHPDSEFQYINTDDVAEIIMKVYTKQLNRGVFNICGTGTIKIGEIIEMYGKQNEKFDISNLKKQRYKINNNKIKKLFSVSRTDDTLKKYFNKY